VASLVQSIEQLDAQANAPEHGGGGGDGRRGSTGAKARATSMLREVLVSLRWTATLSDGTSVPLLPGGADRPVTLGEHRSFVDALVRARLHEADEAMRHVRAGLVSIVPGSVLVLFTALELERRVCGWPGVDIDLLQANTVYDDDVSDADAHIQSFWRVLRGFDDDQRSRMLRFVWARSRLPATTDFHQKFKVQAAVGEGQKDNPDKWLPKAHTCFFSLNLPRYSSDAVMRKQLLYAVENCIEMDADFRLADNEMTGWGDLGVVGDDDEDGGDAGGGGAASFDALDAL